MCVYKTISSKSLTYQIEDNIVYLNYVFSTPLAGDAWQWKEKHFGYPHVIDHWINTHGHHVRRPSWVVLTVSRSHSMMPSLRIQCGAKIHHSPPHFPLFIPTSLLIGSSARWISSQTALRRRQKVKFITQWRRKMFRKIWNKNKDKHETFNMKNRHQLHYIQWP